MDFLKPILNLALNQVQSFGNLGSSNSGLAIEIISNDTHGKVSSLSSTSISNKKNQRIRLYNHHAKIKTLDYVDSSVKNLQKSTQQEQKDNQSISLSSSSQKSENFIYKSNQIIESSLSNKIQVVKKSNYWQVLQDCRNKKVKFTDLQFPANENSMGTKNFVISQKKFNGWKRISQVIENPSFVKNFDPIDPIQGQIGNCYFLSSVASLASDYPNLFEQIFASHQISEEGIYMARFYAQGILVEVVVDDYIPVDKQGFPLYAKATKDFQIWPIILQKCWAKFFKSYERIASGSPHQVFYALTGSPYGIKIADQLPKERKKQQFIKLYKFQNKGSLFSCNTLKAPQKDFSIKGLVPLHAYSVLKLIIDPLCIVKLRNPWGYNKGQNPKNGYYFDWKEKLTKQYGAQNYEKIIEQLNLKYNIDLFGPQTDGIFYMHYDEFMKYFKSITVCPIYNTLNLLTFRSVFFKNKPKFFYFDLTKPGPVIVTMSQMFKKVQQQAKDQTHPYAITSLILAKQVKKRSIRKFSSTYSDTDLSLKISQSLRISDRSGQNKISQSPQSQMGEDEVYYQFISARSNNSSTPFNFVSMQQKVFQPGRYIIFASGNMKQVEMKKNFSITVYCQDSCFPQQLTNHEELYPQDKPKSLLDSLKKINTKNDIEVKWLEQVLLDKIFKDSDEDRRQIGDYNVEVKRKLSNEEFEKLENNKVSLEDSWFIFKTNSFKSYEKMGGFGYFVCHLSQTHPNTESFIFPEKQFNRRCIKFLNSNGNAVKQNGKVRLDVNPGETKIIILKINIPVGQNDLKQLQSRYPNYDFASAPSLPQKQSISSSQKLGIGSQTTLTSLSFLPAF